MFSRITCGIALFAILSTSILAQQCAPGDNCKLPDCRCWDDPTAPGGFNTPDIPQIIVVSFQYGVNSANIDSYTQLFQGINNPNKCPARGSFYVTKSYTDFKVTKKLFYQRHEVGVSAINTAIPTTADEWAGNFTEVKRNLVKAGIPKTSITGVRAPELVFGGNKQVHGMRANNLSLQYDSSCVNIKYDAGNYLWPYTFDFVQGLPECTAGRKVTKPYKGVWEFPLADLQYKGIKCAVPSSCGIFMKTEKDAYDLFFNAFSMHYNQKTRPPFFMYIDAAWVTNETHVTGTKQFLQFIAAAFEDTWIVTAQQALAWIRKPVPASEALKFAPWGCT